MQCTIWVTRKETMELLQELERAEMFFSGENATRKDEIDYEFELKHVTGLLRECVDNADI